MIKKILLVDPHWIHPEISLPHLGDPGQGTTFKTYLPRVDEAPEEIKRKAEGDVLAQGWETILVVEDEEELRKLAVQVLQKHGYRVLGAPQRGMLCLSVSSTKIRFI